MPNYRSLRTPGATWFFTVNLLARRDNHLLVTHIDLLRECVAAERARRPFQINAWVVARWRSIKSGFVFREHQIRDEDDMQRHVGCIHINPAKHGLVQRVVDWPWSSFQRYVRDGLLAADWACASDDINRFEECC